MHRALITSVLPALAVVPASYFITRKTRVAPPMAAGADSKSSSQADNEPSYSREYLNESLNVGAAHYKDQYRKEMDAEISQWFSKIDATLVPCVENLSYDFISNLSYIYTMYATSTSTAAITKYLFTKRFADVLASAKSQDELRIVQVLAKHYNLIPVEAHINTAKLPESI
jgi:hypothetical protein